MQAGEKAVLEPPLKENNLTQQARVMCVRNNTNPVSLPDS